MPIRTVIEPPLIEIVESLPGAGNTTRIPCRPEDHA